MHVYKGEKPREEKEKRKERELVNVARDIFGRQTRITYIDLCEQLQQVLDIMSAHRKELYPLHAGKGLHHQRHGEPKAVLSSVHIIFKGTQAARRRMG